MFFPNSQGQPAAACGSLEEQLYNWIRFHIQAQSVSPSSAKIEIEAKIGRIIDKAKQERIRLPVCNEVILSEESSSWYRFESDIPLSLHRHFNQLLNSQVSQNKLSYVHTRTVDRLYDGPSRKTKRRVTLDELSGSVIESIDKKRISDISIHFPFKPFDIRISINVEIPSPLQNGNPDLERRKDRMSYKESTSGLQLDLTQVRQTGEDKPRHELEIEVTDAHKLAESPENVHGFFSSIKNIIDATAAI